MTNNEQRIFRLEGLVRKLQQDVNDLQIQLGQVAQNQYAQAATGTGSGGGGGVYFAVSSSGSWGATWSGGAPSAAGSISATVYQISGTTITNLGTQTIRNWYPATPANGLVLQVAPDGSGGYVVIDQSCS